ncbi:DUF6894 family protein [Methylobacterium sp. NPDC080182]|uniref:DUF6894 family protein n=1 Tax=Methylobacterium sp. NPDC080182 TaxID=3390590 RepID=UPI003D006C29
MEARVPRYFFHVHDGHSEIDLEGLDAASVEAARLMAVQLAAETLREGAHRRMFGDAWYLEVFDETGGMVCSVDVRVTVPVAGG